MKTKRNTKTRIAILVGITGGFVFLLFYLYSFGLEGDDLLFLAGLFGTIVLTGTAFFVLNSK